MGLSATRHLHLPSHHFILPEVLGNNNIHLFLSKERIMLLKRGNKIPLATKDTFIDTQSVLVYYSLIKFDLPSSDGGKTAIKMLQKQPVV